MRTKWTVDELSHLQTHYATDSTADVASRLGRTAEAIRIKGHKLGLNKPHVRGITENDWTPAEIKVLREFYPTVPTKQLASQFGRTVRGVSLKAHKLGIKKIGRPGYVFPDHLRRYAISDNLFQELTPSTAYVLGFILADGNIYKGRLKIAIIDYDALDKMRRVMQSTHPIIERHSGVHAIWELGIIHKATVDNLIARGIAPRKSLTAVLPDVPDNLFSHFIRGYFDGDGAVRYSQRGGLIVKFTSGSPVLLQQINTRLHTLYHFFGSSVTYDKGRPSACRLYYYGKNAALLGNIMYTDAGDLYMTRKHQVFGNYADR